MQEVDIMECITNAIERAIFKEWKHEGFIGGFTSKDICVEIDRKSYILTIREVTDTDASVL